MILYLIVIILATVIPLLLAVAFLTLVERRVIGAMQRRIGPNVIGAFGILQPFLDGLKLLLKEPILPSNADQALYYWAPVLTFLTSQIRWRRLPTSRAGAVRDLSLGAIYVLAVGSLGVYGILLAGWSGNSSYAFLGCCRSVAQMISYELPIGLIVLTACMFANSLNLSTLVHSQARERSSCIFLIPLWPIALLWIICSLAELNRAPMDLPEAEAELVAGYNVEYASMGFALFFIREYSNMILMGRITRILFLGGGLRPFPFSELQERYSFFRNRERKNRKEVIETVSARTTKLETDSFETVKRKNSVSSVQRAGEFQNFLLDSAGGDKSVKKEFMLRRARFWLRLKTTAVVFLYIWVRATLPRYKYSQLIALGWKRLLPLALAGFVRNAFFVFHVQIISQRKIQKSEKPMKNQKRMKLFFFSSFSFSKKKRYFVLRKKKERKCFFSTRRVAQREVYTVFLQGVFSLLILLANEVLSKNFS